MPVVFTTGLAVLVVLVVLVLVSWLVGINSTTGGLQLIALVRWDRVVPQYCINLGWDTVQCLALGTVQVYCTNLSLSIYFFATLDRNLPMPFAVAIKCCIVQLILYSKASFFAQSEHIASPSFPCLFCF